MSMGASPCYQCKDRKVGCHSKCEAYKAYDAGRKAAYKFKTLESTATSAAFNGRNRRKAI